jgi:hypothetical protein
MLQRALEMRQGGLPGLGLEPSGWTPCDAGGKILGKSPTSRKEREKWGTRTSRKRRGEQQVPFGFAQGRLSTTPSLALRLRSE